MDNFNNTAEEWFAWQQTIISDAIKLQQIVLPYGDAVHVVPMAQATAVWCDTLEAYTGICKDLGVSSGGPDYTPVADRWHISATWNTGTMAYLIMHYLKENAQ
jgi:hypothetical protein